MLGLSLDDRWYVLSCQWMSLLGLSDMVVDVFLPWLDVSVGMAFLTWFLDVFLPWSNVSVGWAFLTWFSDVFLPWSDISAKEDEDLHGC